jgi:DNA primase
VPDKYESVRSLSFPALALALGLDLDQYRQRKLGKEWYGPCPVHNPKQNSTSFSYAADGKFNCFSCNAKGRGGIDLYKLVKNVGFQAAVEALSARPTVEPSQIKSPATGQISAAGSGEDQGLGNGLKPFTGQYHKFAVPSPWLEARIPDAGTREKYGVFCYNNPARKSAWSGRVMIPIKDVEGVLFGYLGRSTAARTPDSTMESQNAKYLFPRDFPKSHFLFGAYELRQHLLAFGGGRTLYHQVFLLESPFAVMKFASYGLPALSPFGWNVSHEQIEILKSLGKAVIYLPDRNKERDGIPVSAELARHLWLRFPPLPAGVDDPEQMTKEQILAL